MTVRVSRVRGSLARFDARKPHSRRRSPRHRMSMTGDRRGELDAQPCLSKGSPASTKQGSLPDLPAIDSLARVAGGHPRPEVLAGPRFRGRDPTSRSSRSSVRADPSAPATCRRWRRPRAGTSPSSRPGTSGSGLPTRSAPGQAPPGTCGCWPLRSASCGPDRSPPSSSSGPRPTSASTTGMSPSGSIWPPSPRPTRCTPRIETRDGLDALRAAGAPSDVLLGGGEAGGWPVSRASPAGCTG